MAHQKKNFFFGPLLKKFAHHCSRICHLVIWWPVTQEIQLVPPEQ